MNEAPDHPTETVATRAEPLVLIGAVASIVTTLTAVVAVFIALRQLDEQRTLTARSLAYETWTELQNASLENPDLTCPNTDEAFAKVMSSPDPRSELGGTMAARYTAYGLLVIRNSEELLALAPDDKQMEFVIRERMRCHAPALRFLKKDGTFDKRYSCGLRRLIADELAWPAPDCRVERP